MEELGKKLGLRRLMRIVPTPFFRPFQGNTANFWRWGLDRGPIARCSPHSAEDLKYEPANDENDLLCEID